MENILVYTDGSADNSKKKDGGIGVVIRYRDPNGKMHKKDYSEGRFIGTTSARMEIFAVIRALELIKSRKKHKIIINSDNQYVVNTVKKGWLFNWISRGQEKKNMDMWRRFYKLYNDHGGAAHVELRWVKGHNGHPLNELADGLAKSGRARTTLMKDTRT